MSKNDKPKKKKDSRVPKDESKHSKFIRVCSPRVRKALKAIKLIGNCSTNDYAYSKEQVDKITEALYKAVNTLDQQFSGTHAAATAFSL